MVYLYWILFIIYSLTVVGTIISVLMDNRQPVKTMAWVMAVMFMPVVGIILYFFFGQDTRKEKLISQHSLDLLTKSSMLEFAVQKDLVIPEENKTLVKL
ncbi:MAG TPA: cardiolipin synthase, partial [Prevotella sp.]|nr:cardiolipin synthase [Prevotella sp.]